MMRRYPLALFIACTVPLSPSHAQPPAVPKPPIAADRVYFPNALERYAAGKPVPLVAVSLGPAMGRPRPALKLEGKTFKQALYAIADAYSDRLDPDPPPTAKATYDAGHETLIPVALGGIWTIGREHQWQINEQPNVPDVLDAVTPMVLLPHWMRTLSDDQLRKATASGLRFDDLGKEQQTVLRAAFRAPTRLFTATPPPTYGSAPGRTRDFDGILPIEKCSFWLHLAFDDIYLPSEAGHTPPDEIYIYGLDRSGKMMSVPEFPTAPSGYTFPILTSVPAKLKAGDLVFDDKSLDAPIGVSGVLKLDKAVETAAKATGLALRVDPRFAGYNVMFIGDAKLRCGDVLRVMAFDVQGAWRRVGDAILLTFDREPLAPTLARWKEQIDTLNKDRDALLNKMLSPKPDDSTFEERLLHLLQTDPDGPPGPDADQINGMVEKAKGPNGPAVIERMKFADLTSEQQADVLQRMRSGRNGDSPDPDSPIGQQLLQKAEVMDFVVRATVEVPNLGRYKVQSLSTRVSPSSIAFATARKAGDFDPPAVKPDEPIVLTAKTRAVAVPPLSRSEWPRLFAQMKRKGLNTLYLPVLWDGYTLYPSKQFPLLPTAKEKDVLADVLSQAAAQKVRVVAVLHTLAWRHPGGGDLHWLRKRPELVDTDWSGQGRREWTNAHLAHLAEHNTWDYGRLFGDDAFLFSDMVKPSDSTVRARLLGVLDELKGYRGLSGVAFAEWSRVSVPHYFSSSPGMLLYGPPALGFGVPQRAAFIKEHSTDPGDFGTSYYSPIRIPTFSEYIDLNALDNAWSTVRMKEDGSLLKDLIAASRKSWPGRVHLFSALEIQRQEEMDAIPTADVAICAGFIPMLQNPSAYAWLAALPDLTSGLPDADGKVPDRLSSLVRSLNQLADVQERSGRGPGAGVVLDFRAAPSLLWDGLARLENAKLGMTEAAIITEAVVKH
ncbi:MAG TPA: hypothetical protein VGM51_04200 [Armatimonadota bacterium]|jgi:hypothetical protein